MITTGGKNKFLILYYITSRIIMFDLYSPVDVVVAWVVVVVVDVVEGVLVDEVVEVDVVIVVEVKDSVVVDTVVEKGSMEESVHSNNFGDSNYYFAFRLLC